MAHEPSQILTISGQYAELQRLTRADNGGVLMPRNKRTRQERVDDAVLADGETWEVDFLLARRTGSATGKQYLVRWKGFTDKHDTWYACLSPSSCLSHAHTYRQTEADLAGAKELMVDFNRRKDQEQESE